MSDIFVGCESIYMDGMTMSFMGEILLRVSERVQYLTRLHGELFFTICEDSSSVGIVMTTEEVTQEEADEWFESRFDKMESDEDFDDEDEELDFDDLDDFDE